MQPTNQVSSGTKTQIVDWAWGFGGEGGGLVVFWCSLD